MFTRPETMPGDSRIWIYQSNRLLSADEEADISFRAEDFIESWTAHNKELKGSFDVLHHMFLVFMIDENHTNASGCSIDKSLHFIQKIEKEFSVSLLERMNIAVSDNNSIRILTRKDFDAAIRKGEINDNTIVFDNLITQKDDLKNNWRVPLHKSWIKSVS